MIFNFLLSSVSYFHVFFIFKLVDYFKFYYVEAVVLAKRRQFIGFLGFIGVGAIFIISEGFRHGWRCLVLIGLCLFRFRVVLLLGLVRISFRYERKCFRYLVPGENSLICCLHFSLQSPIFILLMFDWFYPQ